MTVFFSCRLPSGTQEEQVGDSFSCLAILKGKGTEGAPGSLQHLPCPNTLKFVLRLLPWREDLPVEVRSRNRSLGEKALLISLERLLVGSAAPT